MTLMIPSHFEEWRVVPGFSDYEVSDLGRVRRCRKGGNNYAKAGRILRQQIGSNGYAYLGMWRDGKCYRRLVHRLVALAFLGEPPTPKHEVGHRDGNRHINVLWNLRWCTRKENHADKRKHGTAQVGKRNGNAKLSVSDKRAIRKSLGTHADVAAEFGVHKGTIARIRQGARQ